MNILLVVGVGGVLLFLATRTWPFMIARVFRENDADPTPATTRADGRDFVPTRTGVVFAHHFASIAGAGPIIGPIVALAYGWGPAWLWIVIGGVFYGGVQDMTSMFVSLRERGVTIAEVARRTLGKGGYLLFVLFLLIVLSIVNAIFLKLSAAALTSAYPLTDLGDGAQQYLRTTVGPDGVVMGHIGGIATTSVILMTMVAPLFGLMIHRWNVRSRTIFPLAALVCAASVLAGFRWPVELAPDAWQIVLAVYLFVACWIPVWIIIQPRDFMNVQILYGGIALLLVGVVVTGLFGTASAMQIPFTDINGGTIAKGPIWPIMFITIACGAISGFHTLVTSGTTVRQITRESDCRRVGYNAMILECFLALLVVAAVGSQLSGATYAQTMSSGGGWILTFAVGCGQLFTSLGIPLGIGSVLAILVLEGFLITTLDTAVRLGRYLFEELWQCLWDCDREALPPLLRSTAFNTICVIAAMLLFVYSKQGYAALWPYFGAGNQLIGALALTTVTVWLLQRGRRAWFAAVPAATMVVTAMAALGYLVAGELDKLVEAMDGSRSLAPHVVSIGAGTVLLALAGAFVVVSVVRVYGALRRSASAPIDERG